MCSTYVAVVEEAPLSTRNARIRVVMAEAGAGTGVYEHRVQLVQDWLTLASKPTTLPYQHIKQCSCFMLYNSSLHNI